MTWTPLSDDFHYREDTSSVGRSARLLLLEVMTWCNVHQTGGRIPARMLRRITDSTDLEADTRELLNAGILTPAGDGMYQIDWIGLGQEPVEVVAARKANNAKRQREYTERKILHAAGDHTKCTDGCRFRKRSTNASPNSSTDASSNALVTPSMTLPSPLPSSPLPEGERGKGTSSDEPVSADAPTGRRTENRAVESHVIVENFGDDMLAVTLDDTYPDGTLQAAAAARAVQFGVMGGGYDEVLGALVVRRDWADGARTILAAAVEALEADQAGAA